MRNIYILNIPLPLVTALTLRVCTAVVTSVPAGAVLLLSGYCGCWAGRGRPGVPWTVVLEVKAEQFTLRRKGFLFSPLSFDGGKTTEALHARCSRMWSPKPLTATAVDSGELVH